MLASLLVLTGGGMCKIYQHPDNTSLELIFTPMAPIQLVERVTARLRQMCNKTKTWNCYRDTPNENRTIYITKVRHRSFGKTGLLAVN